jgi:hypothetical protein
MEPVGIIMAVLIVLALVAKWYQGYVRYDADQSIRRMDERDRKR